MQKLFMSGVYDVVYGLGNMFSGLFGSFEKGPDGKRHYNRGMITAAMSTYAWPLIAYKDIKTFKNWRDQKTVVDIDEVSGNASLVTRAEERELVKARKEKQKQEERERKEAERKNKPTRTYLPEEGRYLTVGELEEFRKSGRKIESPAEVAARQNRAMYRNGILYADDNGFGNMKVFGFDNSVKRSNTQSEQFDSFNESLAKSTKNLDKFNKGLADGFQGLDNVKKTFKEKLVSFFDKFSLSRGFMKGFKKASEAKRAKSEEKERNSSFINRTAGRFLDIITGKEKPKDSPLTQICDVLNEIKENTLPEEERKKAKKVKVRKRGKKGSEETSGWGNDQEVGLGGEGFQVQSQSGNEDASKPGFFKNIANKIGGTKVGSAIKTAAGGISNSASMAVVKDLLTGIGSTIGGLAQVAIGILKICMSVLATMSGLKAVKRLVEDILVKGLKPLNQVFTKLYHMIYPLAKQLTYLVRDIAKSLTKTLSNFMKVLKPLLSAIKDSIDIIFKTIFEPAMERLDVMLNSCIVPITLALDMMKPVIYEMCAELQMISGIIQVGFGAVNTALGMIGGIIGKAISGIGSAMQGTKILKKAGRKVEGVGDKISESADNMYESGIGMMQEGAKMVKSSFAMRAENLKKMVTLDYIGSDEEEHQVTIDEERANKINLSDDGANFGAGNVNTYNTWNYTYGSGNTMNQHTYGPTMNMSERGCGPVALADAYSRRTGNGMSPLTLAGAMMGNGSYEPNRGTSVASMVNTGRSLGMNMQVGGVTQRSLNSASPSNPITIMGSGSGFGTKRGNDHYLNVVGSDGRGNSYVSNPLNGRVSKTPTSQLALNSRLGLYGSGDTEARDFLLPEEFGIDSATMDMLDRLKELGERFEKIFTGDDPADVAKKALKEGKEQNMSDYLDSHLSGLSDEDKEAVKTSALKMAKNDFRKKRDGESEEEYNKAFETWYADKAADYINKVKQDLYVDTVNTSASDKAKNYDLIEKQLGGMHDTLVAATKELHGLSDQIDSEEGSSGGGNGTFLTDSGVPMFNYGKPKYTDVQIHDWITESNHTSGHSPLHDFFTQTNDDQTALSFDGNWYNQESNPDNIGVGSSGRNHGGIDINWQTGSEGKKALATTGGVVTMVSTDPTSSQGYAVKWRDSGDMYHWYMHLRDVPLVKKDDKIEGGDLLGYVGNTGASQGAHLHYTITKNVGGYSDDPGHINPLTYFSTYNSASAGMYGDTTIEHLWSYMLTNGYTPEAIAGFLGFIYGESGSTGDLDPKTLFNQGASSDLDAIGNKMREGNKEYVSNASDYTKLAYRLFDGRSMSAGNVFQGSDGVFYPDTGIAQWVGKNTEGLLAMGKQENIPWTNEGLQVRYFSDVYANSIKDRLNTAKSLEDAFEIAMYKNAGDPEQYPGGAAGFRSARLPFARAIYEKYRNADISQWTGYAEQHAQSTIDSSKNNNNSYGYNGQMYDVGDPATRKNMYIRFYKDLSHIKATLTEDQYFSQFTQYLAEWPQELVTEDAKELLTDDIITQYIENVIALHSDFKTELKNREKNISKGAPSSAYDAVRKDLIASKVTEYRSKYGRNPYMWAAVKSSGWTIDTTIFSAEGVEPTPIDNSNGMTGIVDTQDSALNIRSKPDTSSDIIGTLDKGTKVTVAPTNDTSWYAYDYNGKQGYVSSNYIKLDQTGSTYLKYASPYLGDTGYTPDPQQAVNNYNNTKSTEFSNNFETQSTLNKYAMDSTGGYVLPIEDRPWITIKSAAAIDALNTFKERNTLDDDYSHLVHTEVKQDRDYNYDGYIGVPVSGNPRDRDGSTWQIITQQGFPDGIFDFTQKYINALAPDHQTNVEFVSDEGNAKARYSYYDNSGLWLGNDGAVIRGSGDVSPEVPAVDMSQLFDETSQTMRNATNAFTGGTTVVVTRDDQSTADMITRLSEITFKVRNERVEELLEELVDYVKTSKKKSSTFNHVHGSNNYTVEDMFEDEIPEAVMRLSKGG